MSQVGAETAATPASKYEGQTMATDHSVNVSAHIDVFVLGLLSFSGEKTVRTGFNKRMK